MLREHLSYPFVLGTAGHIDHGKTSLVRELTGIDTDRLAIEKARGITTELGFARLDIGGRRIAVVDVPGHERFVKSMVAGATGLDLVLLVVAADEGVMPQTREHLDICDLLGIRRGLIVLTKLDLVEPDWLALVSADVRAAVTGTFLAEAPLIPVSVRSGEGFARLRDEISRVVDTLPPRDGGGLFRLPVDRVFTVKGFGTVVTGTVLGGTVCAGDELEVIPTGLRVRVRGVEIHGSAAERAQAGHRAALNLGGVAIEDLARGDLLTHPERVAGSHILDVELRVVGGASGPLPPKGKVLVHHGTAQRVATYVLLDGVALEPGGSGLAQLRVTRDAVLGALPGDRFILRGFIPRSSSGSTGHHGPPKFVANATGGSTIGGGHVIRVLAPKARSRDVHARAVGAFASARLEQRIGLDIKAAASAGRTRRDVEKRLGVTSDEISEPFETLVTAGELLGAGDHYIHAETVADIEHQIVQTLQHADDVGREELRTRLPAALPLRIYDAILARLSARGVAVAGGDRVSKAAPRTSLSPIEETLLAKLEASGLEPPRPKELPTLLGLSEQQVKTGLDRLVAAKLAVKIKPDLILHARIVHDIRTRLVAFLDAHATIDAQQWKELTGASRKYTIPLAEYFDGEKVTLRVGDVRRKRDQKK